MNPNLLRAKMAECGLSQGKTAELIGICENSLTRKLSGERDFKLSEVRSLCRVLNITDPARVFDLKLTQTYGITPSMSRRGNPFDNAVAENFFSILKTECIYRHKPTTFSEANEMIDRYIYFYNHERIQLKTGEAPLVRRLST